jgi:hypothetical protein
MLPTYVSIVKRDKRTWDAEHYAGRYPALRGIRMRERAYNLSAHFRVGWSIRTVLS